MSEHFPLSGNQHDIWLDQQFYESTVPYHIAGAVQFTGSVDPKRLIQATRHTLDQIEALRLVFEFDGDTARQRVSAEAPVDIPLIDLSDQPDPEAAAHDLIMARQARPFPMDHPPVRLALVRLSPTRVDWTFVFHHLIADGWGWSRVMAQLIANYNRLCRDEPPAPAPPAFSQSLAREARYRASSRFQKDRVFWRDLIANLPDPVDLPQGADLHAVRHTRPLPRRTWQRLEDMTRQHGATPFQALIGLLGIYLGRALNRDALTLKLPMLNRGSGVLKRTPGLFVGEKPFVLHMSAGTRFSDYLVTIAADMRRAYRHQTFPLGELPASERAPDREGRFSVSYQKHHYDETPVDADFRIVQEPPVEQRTALTLHVREYDEVGPLQLDFDYQAALFTPASMANTAGGLLHLLEVFLAHPEADVDAPHLLPEKALLAAEHALHAKVPDVEPLNLVQTFRRVVAERGAHPAVWQDGRSWNYDTLGRDSDRIAHRLRTDFGVGPEVPVALLSSRGYTRIAGVMGILASGGYLLPLDPEHPPERRLAQLSAAGCRLMLVDRPRPDAQPTGVEVVHIDALISHPATTTPPPPPPLPDPQHTAFVLFTSGSTGTPKGCRITHANLGAYLATACQNARRMGGVNEFQHGPLTFDIRLGTLLLALMEGGTVTVPPADLNAVEAVRHLVETTGPADTVSLCPSHMDILAASDGVNPNITRVLFSGEALPQRTLRDAARHFPNARFINEYGPTEASIGCAFEEVMVDQPITLGRHFNGAGLHVVDDRLRLVPGGVVGELLIGGPLVGGGYIGQPGLTAAVFVPDPFGADPKGGRLYRTGDLVRRLDDGRLAYLGRRDHQLKINGQRVEPGEIEAVLCRHPRIQAAVVTPVTRRRGLQLAAFYTADAPLDAAELDDFLAPLLPAAMIPAPYLHLSAMPLTASGKTDRKALAARAAEQTLTPTAKREPIAPRNRDESDLVRYCRDLLGPVTLSMDDRFMDLGGDSLAAVRLAAMVRAESGRRLAVRDILQSHSLAALAQIMGRGHVIPETAPAVDQGDRFPLTPGQWALLLHQERHPQSVTYTMPGLLQLTGDLDVDALSRALTTLQERHEALRIRIAETQTGQDVHQCITHHIQPLTQVDLSGDAHPAQTARHMAHTQALRPFNLRQDAPCRMTLYRISADHHLLLLVFHHLICDGASIDLFFRELSHLYQGASLDPAPCWRNQAVHHPDYRRSPWVTAGAAWWRNQMTGAVRTPLPFNCPAPAAPDFGGAQCRFQLEPQIADALKQLARRARGGPFAAVAALTRVLLFRYTGQMDSTLGAPSAGRNEPGAADAFGYFVNPVALRARIQNDDSFNQVLEHEAETVAAALEYPAPDLEALAEDLGLLPEVGQAPFFDVMVVHQHDPARDLHLPGLDCRLEIIDLAQTKFPLEIVVTETVTGAWSVAVNYRTSRFNQDRMTRFAQHLERLTRDAVKRPDTPISRLHLLSAEDVRAGRKPPMAQANPESIPTSLTPQIRTSILDCGRGGPTRGEGQTVMDLFERQAQINPHATAVIDGTRRLSYRQLDHMANGLALALQQHGVRADHRVGMTCRRGAGQIIGELGVMKAGAALVPMDPDYPAERLAFMAADAQIRVMVTDPGETPHFPLPNDVHRLTLDQIQPSPTPPPTLRHPDLAAYLIYTSGTTGTPKAVVQNHRGLTNVMLDRCADLGLDHHAVCPLFFSISFDAAQLALWPPLISGGACLCVSTAERDDPALLLASLNRHGATHVTLPPAILPLLTSAGALPLKVLISGGEAPDTQLIAQLSHKLTYINDYGPCECAVMVTRHHVVPGEDLSDGVPIGRPLSGVTITLLNDHLELVGPGLTGEIVIGGHAPARGYHGRPDLTALAWKPDPFSDRPGARMYHTGDFGRWDDQGRLHFVGRADGQVKIRGHRVELGEVQRRLARLPGVSAAHVAARTGVAGGKELTAWYVADKTNPSAPNDVRRVLAHVLPDYMRPAFLIPVEAMPLTPNGKIDRDALPKPEDQTTAVTPPADDLERTIARAWESILGRGPLGRESDFFALGGHSVTAMRVAARLREHLPHRLDIRDLFKHPVLADLADHLRSAAKTAVASPIPTAPPAPDYPLSHAQKRLWVLDRMNHAGTAYTMAGAFLLVGDLDADALERALQTLFARHQALRTVFRLRDGEPRQTILPADGLRLNRVDARTQTDPDAHAMASAHADAATPFDLLTGPLFRATLVALSRQRHLLFISLHHIVCDGWSLRIITRELFRFYQQPQDLTPLPLHYKDVAVWQNERLARGELDHHRRFWLSRFTPPPAPLDLPGEFPRPAQPQFQGDRVPLTLDHRLTQALRDLARQHKASPFILLQALVKVLLYRHTGRTDLTIGAPVAGRDHAGLEDQVGFYVNMLALRDDLDPNAGFTTLLQTARDNAASAYAHQVYPFDLLVDQLPGEMDPSRSPLFNVVVAFEDPADMDLTLPGLTVEPRDPGIGDGKFDLTFVFTETKDGGFTGLIEYNTRLYTATHMRGLAAQFAHLAAAVIADHHAPLAALPLHNADDMAQLHRRAMGHVLDRPFTTVMDMVAQQAAAIPERTAVAAHDGALTYAELNTAANRIAAALTAHGSKTETRVAVLMERSRLLPAALLGVWRSGAAYVPFDPAAPEPQLTRHWQRSGCTLMLCAQDQAATARRIAGDHVITLTQALDHDPAEPGRPIHPQQAAYVIFTSGTQGQPKGVVIPHHALTNLIHNYRRRFFDQLPQHPVLRASSFSPFIFDAFVPMTFAPPAFGHQLHLAQASELTDARRAAQFLHKHRIHLLDGTPGFLAAVLDHGGLNPDMALIISGGEALPVALARRLAKGPQLHNAYGPTETCVDAVGCRVHPGDVQAGVVPIGLPYANLEALLLDRNGRPAPEHAVGELCIGGLGLARGYFNQPAATARVFVPHPFREGERLYRTGDLARIQADGRLIFLGRRDAQVKLRGFRIELGEVEEALRRLPHVTDAAAKLITPEGGDARLAAWLVFDDGRRQAVLDAGQTQHLREALLAFLPRYMAPAVFTAIPRLPLTATGKVDRDALIAPDLSNVQHTPPRDAMETQIAAAWCEVLGLETLGIHDDFFTLGGHSLKAVRLAARIHAALGLDLALNEVLRHPTIARQAHLLRERVPDQTPAPTPTQNALPAVSHAQRRMWILDRLDSVAYNMPGALLLEGELNIAALKASFDTVIARHESLRTVFPEQDGEPQARILDQLTVPMPVMDLSDRHDPQTHAESLIKADAHAPFDLARGPLIRLALLRLAPQRHVLMTNMHHIVCDEWSTGVLLNELTQIYRAHQAGEEPNLPAPTHQAGDLIRDALARLTTPALQAQRDYWLTQLAGPLPVLDLPADHPRPARQSFAGGRHHLRLADAPTRALEALAQHRGVTLFTILTGLVKVLLQRHSGQEDVVIGTPVTGRDRVAMEQQIGLYLNTLALRTQVLPQLTLDALLDRVTTTVDQAFAARLYPFDLLVEELNAARDLSRTPVFQVMVVQQDRPLDRLHFHNLTAREFPLDFEIAKFDLTVFFRRDTDGLALTFEYARHLGRTRMQRLAHQLAHLAAAAPDHLDTTVDQLPLLEPAERQRVLALCDRRTQPTAPRDVLSLFQDHVAAAPDAPAVVFGSTTLSYAQLDRYSRHLALHLLDQGLGPEDVVGVALPRGAWVPVAFLAVLRAGGVYLPLDPGYPRDRLGHMVRHAGCRLLLADAAPDWAPAQLTVLSPQAPPQTRATRLPKPPSPQQAAYMIYTSGSSGTPKGVVCTHACLSHLVTWQHRCNDTGLRVAAYAPLSFDVSVQEMAFTLTGGGSLHVIAQSQRRDLHQLAHLLRDQKIQLITMPFSALDLLFGDDHLAHDFADLRFLCTSGEALHLSAGLAQFLERHPHVTLHNQYGPSETHVITAATVTAADCIGDNAPIGVPVDGNAVYLLDAHFQPVPDGVTGELFLTGAHTARGYHGDPGRTAERFLPDPHGASGARMYRSGDLGKLDAQGRIRFLGRNDAQLKIRGFRVEPGEVTHILLNAPHIREAVTLGKTVGAAAELVAYVVAAKTHPSLESDLRRLLSASLPAFMVPAYLVFLDELPRLPSGKLDLNALPAPNPAVKDVDHRPPADALEAQLLTAWRQILGRDDLGVDDDFFAQGGHSLKAMKLIANLRKLLDQETALVDLFEAPTVAAFADRLRQRRPQRFTAYTPVPDAERYPLSPAQARMWLLSRLDTGGAYHVPVLLRLQGELNQAALETALEHVVARHQILRTRFLHEADVPFQTVDPPMPPTLRVHHPRGTEDDALSLLSQSAAAPFNLAVDHPLRIDLAYTAVNNALLLLCFHHIAADGWSLTPLMDDLHACYVAALAQRQPDLTPLPIQYRDYAVHQHQRQDDDARQTQRDYWTRQLAEANPALPTDRPRPPVFSHQGAAHFFDLSAAQTAAVHHLAQTEGLTPFAVLLGAFNLLLTRFTGGAAPNIGTPVANRDHAETAPLIGFFVNTLVLQAQPQRRQSLRGFLKRLRRTITDAFQHGDLPFETLVDHLQPKRDPSRNPLFDVMFVYQGPTADPKPWPGLTLTPVELPHQTAKFDLTLTLLEQDGRLQGCLEYAAQLFSPQTITRLAQCYEQVLHAVTTQADALVANLTLIDDTARRQLLQSAGDAANPAQPHRAVHQRFEVHAARDPHAVALSLDGATMTYGELDQRANQLAHHLHALGVGPETIVALLLKPSFETVIAILAVHKAGGAYLPLDPTQPMVRIQGMLDDARPKALLYHRRDDLTPPPGDHLNLDLADDTAWCNQPTRAPQNTIVSAHQAAYIIYTSGSSGVPKGVLIGHHQVLQLFAACDRLFDLDHHDVWTLFHAYSFDFSVWELWGALAHGARLVLVPYWRARDAAQFLQLLRDERVTVLSQTPSAFGQLLAAEAAEALPADAHPRYVVFGGEALEVSMPADWRRRHPKTATQFINMYGITETTVHVTFRRVTHDTAQGDVGRALPHLAAHVLDADLNLQPVGMPGEIHVSGQGVARGYLNRPALTALRFVPDPYSDQAGRRLYRSGDLAVKDADGAMNHRGRADFQVKIRGYRIELGEIRAVLAAHPAVADAAVIALGQGDQTALAAYIQPRDQAELNPAPREWLAARLPAYMVPAHITTLDQLPLTVNGKLDTRRLPQPESRTDAASVAPRNAVEVQLARIWETVLRRTGVGVHDDFFELGGHSLTAAGITNRIRAELGVAVALRDFFATPTIAALAAQIADAESTTAPHTVLGVPLPQNDPDDDPTATRPVSHAQRRMWFLAQIGDQSAAYNMPHGLALHGDLNAGAMAAAFQALVTRHHGLRTVLRYQNNILSQQVLPASRFTLQRPDLNAADPHVWHTLVRAWCEHDAHQPFDLAQEPPLRAALFTGPESHHVLYFNLHHSAGDGWTIGLIVRELAALYRRHAHHAALDLDPDPLQISAYAAWQHDFPASPAMAAQRDYWLDALKTPPPRLELPLDHPRPAVRGYKGDRRHDVFGPHINAGLEALVQHHGTSLFCVLSAALRTLFYRYTGQTDFALGTPVAGRPHPRFEGLVGCLVNTLALRETFEANVTFSHLLSQVTASTLAALDHQLYPFESLVDELGLDRDTSRPVLFDVMLVLQNAQLDPPDLGGVAVDDFSFNFRTAKFDLLLNFWQVDGDLHLDLEYNTELFEAPRIERLFGHLKTLFQALIRNPDTPLDRLDLMAPNERARLLQAAQGPAPGQRPGLAAAIRRRAHAQPQHLALVQGEARLTYAQLDAWSAALAQSLRHQGVGLGDVVAVCLPREAPIPVCFLAVLRVGAAYVYLDPADPHLRKRQFLDQTRPSAVLVQTPDAAVFGDLPQITPGVPATQAVPFQDAVPHPDSPAYLIYTSGSTGKPKAVVGTHRCLENLMAWQLTQMGPHPRCLGFAAAGFDVAVQEMLYTFYAGGALYYLATVERLDMAGIARLISAEQIDLMTMPYTPLSLFFRQNTVIPSCLRHIVTSGERLVLDGLLKQHMDAAPHAVLHNQYGPSETHVVTAFSLPGGTAYPSDAPPIGTPVADTLCLILDSRGNPVPVGVEGELHLGGANLAQGYLNRPALTAASFVPAPAEAALPPGSRLYRTGDRCVLDAAGQLHYLGRYDDQVKIRGFRVEPGEVAAVLARHPAVSEARVIARPIDGRNALTAYVITTGDCDIPALETWSRERLPDHMRPHAVIPLARFPLTANGKLDRRALPDPKPRAARVVQRAAAGVQAQVAQIWKDVLALDDVDVSANFFELGGNSFNLIEVHGRLKSDFDDQLPIVKLFEHPTIAGLAAFLERRTPTQAGRGTARANARRAARGKGRKR